MTLKIISFDVIFSQGGFYMLEKRKTLLCLIDSACYLGVYLVTVIIAAFSSSAVRLNAKEYIFHFIVTYFVAMLARFSIRVYRNIWRYANSRAYLEMVLADFIAAAISVAIARLTPWNVGVWQTGVIFMGFCLLTLTNRFIYQQIKNREKLQISENKINVAIVGAGSVGVLLAEELVANKRSHYKPYCFIDNAESKAGKIVNGLRVYPEGEETIEKIKTLPIQEIILALPHMSSEDAERLYDMYLRTGCKVKIYDVPVTVEGVSEGQKKRLREINIEDLLFRNSLYIDNGENKDFYKGKTVLVTGGGGSIGSELCRQIAKCEPKKLVIFDIYENNAYDIEQELIGKYGNRLDLAVEIGSVRDEERLDCVFANYRPDIVFHAAAHKHVPLMEHSNCEAIKNNVAGTYNTANMAEKYNVQKFILISTDKAVNPTNIMGASKRMCEMVIQCRTDSNTTFAAVRFGNVLGSNGSVIPLFKRQIENGGPVTITDKRIIRYFMTIPEASQLVMNAGAMAKSGELFVLDMGKPVKILDLAENMIKLSGLVPYEDIDIVETCLRPGEKLYEELLIKNEELDKTDNSLIFIERDHPLSREAVDEKLAMLNKAVADAKDELGSDIVKKAMKNAVPTYHDPEKVNSNAEKAEEMKIVGVK